ncbi:hypothetical protein AVEN_109303-1 [Araneus ventricosus]|uniref:Uncharacterized protein n=1 Tax=Araneus ventricosus TaxID=182803 RepID=A0A4Y2D1D6_ARAVE|nr:hypothetical protein AVEN_109303-1 [Araneus ventricosus]
MKACKATYAIKKVKTAFSIRWWNQILEVKKKDIQALNKRLHKTEGEEKQQYEIAFSEKKRHSLKKTVKKADWNSFWNMCTRATDPFGLSYKAIVKNRHPPANCF